MDTPQSMPFLAGRCCLFSTPSPLKQTDNEDCAALVPVSATDGVLIVADGVGGMPGGQFASSLAVKCLVEGLAGTTRDHLRESILSGFEEAADVVTHQGGGSATTLAAVEVRDRIVRTYHAGDSEILIIDDQGMLRWKTLPHSPVGYGVEAGLLNPRDAIFHEARHLVSNVVGNVPMTIEVSSSIEIGPADTVVLASDGLLDNLHLEEVVTAIAGQPLDEATDALVRETRSRMNASQGGPSKPDDLTLLLFRLDNA